MNNEDIKRQVVEALINGTLQPNTIVLGDNVQHQHRIEKVEAGGIGFQIIQSATSEPVRPAENNDKEPQPAPTEHFVEAEDIDAEPILPIPQKNKYTQVRTYIKERCRFDEEFKDFVDSHSRVELCKRLTNEFGWDVDEHHLGVNMNRHR